MSRVEWFKPYFDNTEREALLQVYDSGWLGQGPKVAELEAACRAVTRAKHCVAVVNGTAALDIALKLLGIQPGDEVIVPAFGYIATANSVRFQAATPVFADVDPVTFNLDPADVARKITKKTKAIIAIDYAGHAAKWPELRQLATDAGVGLVEDAAPSLGARLGDTPLGTFGDVGITSLHMAKSVMSVEGGVIFLNSDEHDRLARMMRSHGESPTEKYVHPILGHNFRMSDLHAAIGVVQVGRLPEVLARRARNAALYNQLLGSSASVRLPVVQPGHTHSWFLYPTLVENRDAVRAEMNALGVGTNVSWPRPIYKQDHFKPFFTEICPVAEWVAERVLCLPLFYELTEAEQEQVAHAYHKAVQVHHAGPVVNSYQSRKDAQ